MILVIGNKQKTGFTLIEVLLSVALLSIGLVFIIKGYMVALDGYGRARFISEGSLILQEKMADGQLEIRSGLRAAGLENGKEKDWRWTIRVKEIQTDKLYEIEVEVFQDNGKNKLTAATYVRS